MLKRTATLTTTTGYTWTTSCNGTDEEICKYFLGQWFDCAPFPKEDMQQVVKCVIDGKSYELTPA